MRKQWVPGHSSGGVAWGRGYYGRYGRVQVGRNSS